jgi:hypothetical protein
MNWNWRDEGFRAEPKRVPAPAGLRLYRAWGGTSEMMGRPSRPGVCFSTQKPDTRSEAERLFSAWEWGNSCLWLTAFRVIGRVELYVGAVHPGHYVDPQLSDPRSGVQVFIENPVHGKLVEVQTMRLADDLGDRHVLPGSRRWQ